MLKRSFESLVMLSKVFNGVNALKTGEKFRSVIES